MRIYFTSDMHLGHDNIIKYCGRPFSPGDYMNKTLIKRWNEKVDNNDVVYHIGDFCFNGGTEGGKTKAQVWERELNGKVIHIAGNHDRNNGIAGLNVALMYHGGKQLLLQHIPPMHEDEIPDFVDLVLCGHVHEKWKHKMVEDIPIINVGVDQWDFRPIDINTILKYYYQVIVKEKKNEKLSSNTR